MIANTLSDDLHTQCVCVLGTCGDEMYMCIGVMCMEMCAWGGTCMCTGMCVWGYVYGEVCMGVCVRGCVYGDVYGDVCMGMCVWGVCVRGCVYGDGECVSARVCVRC